MFKKAIEEYLTEKELVKETIKRTLQQTEIIPSSEAGYFLTPLAELIIKLTYLFGNLCVEQLKVLLLLFWDTRTVETTINDLVKKGYVICENHKPFGNYLCLARSGEYYIKYNPIIRPDTVAINECNLRRQEIHETALLKNMVVLGILADSITKRQRQEIQIEFYEDTQENRRNYYIYQYTKNYVFKDFLKLSAKERSDFFETHKIAEEKQAPFINIKKPTDTAAHDFSLLLMENEEYKSDTRQSEELRSFYKYFVKEIFNKPDATVKALYFFKDYYQERHPLNEKEKASILITQILRGAHNLVKGKEDIIRHSITALFPDKSELIKAETQYVKTENVLIALKRLYRSSLKANTTNPEAPKRITDSADFIKYLDDVINTYEERVKTLSGDFLFSLAKTKQSLEEDSQYEVKALTLEKLKANGIYLTELEKGETSYIIHVAIIHTNNNYFSAQAMAQKIEMAYRYFNYVWNFVELKITIYSTILEEAIQDKLSTAKDIIGSCRELSILHLKFDNMVQYQHLNQTCYFRKSEFWQEIRTGSSKYCPTTTGNGEPANE